jgi:hypothetical protein
MHTCGVFVHSCPEQLYLCTRKCRRLIVVFFFNPAVIVLSADSALFACLFDSHNLINAYRLCILGHSRNSFYNAYYDRRYS